MGEIRPLEKESVVEGIATFSVQPSYYESVPRFNHCSLLTKAIATRISISRQHSYKV